MPSVTLTGIALLGASIGKAAEPPPRVMFQTPQPTVVTSGSGNLNRYHETATTSFPATSSAPLKWRAKSPAVDQASATEPLRESYALPSNASSESQATMLVDGQVRPVAFTLELKSGENTLVSNKPRIRQVSGPTQSVLSARKPEEPKNPADPFKDPFGDKMPTPARIDLRTVQNPAAGGDFAPPKGSQLRSLAPPEQPSAPLQDAATDPQPLESTPAQKSPEVREPRSVLNPDDALPENSRPKNASPRPLVPTPDDAAAEEPPPLAPRAVREVESGPAESSAVKNCRNIYNDRNTCKDQESCQKTSARLLKDSIRQFTRERLDITAPYKPDADTPEEIEQAEERRTRQLTLAGKREWKDRNNQVLAYGQLLELKNRRAIVRDDAGHETPVPIAQLSDDDVSFITAWYELPTECTFRNTSFQGRQFVASTYTWKASSLCHKPLYFEDVQLERYGHTAGPILQPVASFAHFFGNIAILPYKMGINPPHECQYTLGYYRPGSCAPWMIPPVPLSIRGGLAEAGAIIGGAAILP